MTEHCHLVPSSQYMMSATDIYILSAKFCSYIIYIFIIIKLLWSTVAQSACIHVTMCWAFYGVSYLQQTIIHTCQPKNITGITFLKTIILGGYILYGYIYVHIGKWIQENKKNHEIFLFFLTEQKDWKTVKRAADTHHRQMHTCAVG